MDTELLFDTLDTDLLYFNNVYNLFSGGCIFAGSYVAKKLEEYHIDYIFEAIVDPDYVNNSFDEIIKNRKCYHLIVRVRDKNGKYRRRLGFVEEFNKLFELPLLGKSIFLKDIDAEEMETYDIPELMVSAKTKGGFNRDAMDEIKAKIDEDFMFCS